MQISNRLGLDLPTGSAGVSFSSSYQLGICCLLGALLIWELAVIPVSAAPARSSRSLSSAEARLVNSPTDNYIAGMEYADFWQRKRMPLKIFVHPGADVAGFDSRYVEVFKNACQSWSLATDNMVSFEFTEDAAKADIDVQWTANPSTWKSKPDGHELGACEPDMVLHEGIDHASIYLLTTSDQNHVGLKAMQFASLHELGHALGLGHSGRKTDIMARAVEVSKTSLAGETTVDACASEIKLSSRDVTTIKLVYTAKQKLDDIRLKRLDDRSTCFALCNEAARQISAGDSGQAIIFLREVCYLDSSYKVALENLMAAYFNCGVELYNKQHYSEALPILERALDLGQKVGTASELGQMRSVERNCLIAGEQKNQTLPSTPINTQATYSGRAHVRGSR